MLMALIGGAEEVITFRLKMGTWLRKTGDGRQNFFRHCFS
jgi:hypothetical protein